MTFDQAKEAVFASGIIPDGYFGKTLHVDFAFNVATGKTLCVCQLGYFTYQTPPAVDQIEALWLLRNHPSSNVTNLKEVTV